jgi:hypothetical protein
MSGLVYRGAPGAFIDDCSAHHAIVDRRGDNAIAGIRYCPGPTARILEIYVPS